MPLTDTAKNTGLDAIAATITHIGLANVSTEISGGSPAYARQAVTWDAAASGSVAIAASETFDVPSGATVNRVLLRDASTAGNDLGNATVTEEVYGGQGEYTVTALTISLTDA